MVNPVGTEEKKGINIFNAYVQDYDALATKIQLDCVYDPPVRWYRYNRVCTEGVDGDHKEEDKGKPLRSHTGLSYSTVCSRGTVHSKS